MKDANINAEAEKIYKNLTQDQKDRLINLNNLMKDDSFIEKLKNDPRETLRSQGFEVPKETKIILLTPGARVPVPTEQLVMYVPLPIEDCECTMDEMEQVAGGKGVFETIGQGLTIAAGILSLGAVPMAAHLTDSEGALRHMGRAVDHAIAAKKAEK